MKRSELKRSELLWGWSRTLAANETLLSKLAGIEEKYREISGRLKSLEASQRGLAYRYADFESRWPSLKKT